MFMRFSFLFAALACFAAGRAQNCLGYYFLQNNKTVEMALYNKKGDETGRQVYRVSNVINSGGVTTARLDSEMFDKKGKSIVKSESNIKCDGGVVMMDMKMAMPQQQSNQMAKADVKTSEFYIEYPYSMNVGDQLKDAEMHMEIDMGNGMKQSVDMEVKERKVEGKENVTTPAGTWECYKISFKNHMRMKTMGIGVPVNTEGIEWYAPGFGIVKTESKQGRTAIVAIK